LSMGWMSRFICLFNFAGYPDGLLVEDEHSMNSQCTA